MEIFIEKENYETKYSCTFWFQISLNPDFAVDFVMRVPNTIKTSV